MEPLAAAARVVDRLELVAGCPYYMDHERCALQPGMEDGVRELASELEDDLRHLGSLFFPKHLLEFFEERGVGHVILCPDPRMFALPWTALLLPLGEPLLNASWTLSVVPAPHSLLAWMGSDDKPRACVEILAPDREVNANLGGDLEIAAISELFQVETRREQDASLGALRELLDQGAWVHIRTHGSPSESSGLHFPQLIDGLWEEPPVEEGDSRSVVVAASCRTGEARSRGQDLFGLVEVAERSNVATLIAPVHSVDGIVTSLFMKHFYEGLVAGLHVPRALKSASVIVRERLIHPVYWAPFLCVGDFRAGVRPESEAEEG